MAFGRTLLVLLALLTAIAMWVAASGRVPATLHVVATDMAPDPGSATFSPLPDGPPDGLDWQPLDQRTLAGWRGPYWLRWRFEPATDASGEALRLSLRAASRSYWDGQPLPANGRVGRHADEEHPGRIDVVHLLPRPAGHPRMHELLVFASSHHAGMPLRSADASVQVASAQALYAGRERPWLVAAVAVGALAAAWLYLLAVRWGTPRSTGGARLLLGLGAVAIALPAVEAARPLLGYTYDWHGPRLLGLLGLHLAAALLLPAYLARRFDIGSGRVGTVGYVMALVAVTALLPTFDGRGATLLLLSLLASIALLLRTRREPGERVPILALLTAGALAIPLVGGAFLDGPYFLMLAVLMGFLLLRHAVHLRAVERDNARLLAERARLSLQLLQRGMQPHWLMNSLTSLQELIERHPSRAGRMVESLAEQFDRLRETSAHARVPLDDELALCRSHLRIVGLAHDRPIGLEVDIEGDAPDLPPGVLHAQVENALTHAGAAACAARPFRLRVRHEAGRHVVELRSALGAAPRPGQGTGRRYIEASLAAACPGGWRFVQGADGADWCGRIELACAC